MVLPDVVVWLSCDYERVYRSSVFTEYRIQIHRKAFSGEVT